MFGYIPISEQIIKERAKNAANAETNNRLAADLDYLAMMSDIDLENDGAIIGTDLANGEEEIADDGKEGRNNAQ